MWSIWASLSNTKHTRNNRSSESRQNNAKMKKNGISLCAINLRNVLLHCGTEVKILQNYRRNRFFLWMPWLCHITWSNSEPPLNCIYKFGKEKVFQDLYETQIEGLGRNILPDSFNFSYSRISCAFQVSASIWYWERALDYLENDPILTEDLLCLGVNELDLEICR